MKDFLLVNLKKVSVWNYYSTREEAEKVMIEKEEEGYNVIMSYTEFQELQKKEYCSNTTEITEKEFFEVFECLPPLQYTKLSDDDFYFLMSEYLTGDITAQYLKKDGCYYVKNVVVGDSTTYINDKSIQEAGESKMLEIENKFDTEELEIYNFLIDEANYYPADAEQIVVDREYVKYNTLKMEDVARCYIKERADISADLEWYFDFKLYGETLENNGNFYFLDDFIIEIY